jgi:hypothetical protein
MKQFLTMKGRSLMLTVLFTLSLAALIVLSGAASKAEAQSSSAVPTSAAPGPDPFLDPDQFDQLTGCPWYMYEECAITPGDVSGAATATPSASATTASPSASATASAAGDQYGLVPDTGSNAAAPGQTDKAENLPDTSGRTAESAENSSALPLMLGAGALLVGGGLLARRLIR